MLLNETCSFKACIYVQQIFLLLFYLSQGRLSLSSSTLQKCKKFTVAVEFHKVVVYISVLDGDGPVRESPHSVLKALPFLPPSCRIPSSLPILFFFLNTIDTHVCIFPYISRFVLVGVGKGKLCCLGPEPFTAPSPVPGCCHTTRPPSCSIPLISHYS